MGMIASASTTKSTSPVERAMRINRPTIITVAILLACAGAASVGFLLGEEFGYSKRILDEGFKGHARGLRSDLLRQLLEADDLLQSREVDAGLVILRQIIWDIVYTESVSASTAEARVAISVCPHLERLNKFRSDFMRSNQPHVADPTAATQLDEALVNLQAACSSSRKR